VKTLVDMHGGRIAARSAGAGQGTEFELCLPMHVQPPRTASPRRAGAPMGSDAMPPRRRILVVDDNTDAAKSLARLLGRLLGQDVRTAKEGGEAIALAHEFRPEVILLDIGMPGMDGYEVARRLREDPTLHATQIVALTGWGGRADRQRSREAGFNVHLVKPVEAATLRRLLLEMPVTNDVDSRRQEC
jgi:CheY-like chemotaxis protein